MRAALRRIVMHAQRSGRQRRGRLSSATADCLFALTAPRTRRHLTGWEVGGGGVGGGMMRTEDYPPAAEVGRRRERHDAGARTPSRRPPRPVRVLRTRWQQTGCEHAASAPGFEPPTWVLGTYFLSAAGWPHAAALRRHHGCAAMRAAPGGVQSGRQRAQRCTALPPAIRCTAHVVRCRRDSGDAALG